MNANFAAREQEELAVDIGDGQTIRCRIRPSRGKNIRLSVSEHGALISLPPLRRLSEARDFLIKNRKWVSERHRHALERHRQRQIDLQSIPRRLNLLAVGEQWTVNRLMSEDRLRLETQADGKTLILRGGIAPLAAHSLLRRWMNRYARVHLSRRLVQLAADTGLKPGRLLVANQKTRHGSRSSKGSISLNRQLLFYPPALVDSVIIHELCHIPHRNHSRQFWSLAAAYDPDHKKHNRQIREREKNIPAWAQGALRPAGV